MAEILLMRHAKSDHPDGFADIDRPLTRRGLESAGAMGRSISRFDAVPDLVLSSPARRALDTATEARRSGGWPAPLRVIEAFYGGGARQVIDETIAAWEGERVLIVGHEPTWSQTVNALIGGGRIQMVTAAVACIELDTRGAIDGGWLRWMLHPRLLDS